MENKNSYFIIDLKIPNYKSENDHYHDKLKDSVDLILASMGVEEEPEQYQKKDKNRMIYFFKTSKRKRKGQLVKFCNRYLPGEVTYRAEGITKSYLNEELIRLNRSENFQKEESLNSKKYNGDDIKILDTPENWKPWQREIFNKFFNADLSFKKPEARTIYSLVDIEGNSGKSIFYKWLIVKVGEEHIGSISFGTASQLRSSVINMGPKKMYFLDLTRTKGRDDSEHDLMSALESIANGLVFSPMYGKGTSLLMEPPHIMMTSNYLLEYELLSLDRWRVYEIKEDGTLGRENEIFQNPSKRKEILRQQNKKTQQRIDAKKC
jgi:hypothetical protein